MNRKARQELIGIGALAVGLFLGLTLLRLPITGSWGDEIGSRLWRVLGVGSVLLPVLGIGWALAAFERLGSLSAGRAAALGAGLILLLPYGIGTVTGASFPPAYAAWSPTQQLVGSSPPCWLTRASGGGDRGGDTRGPVRALGAGDSHGRLASAGRAQNTGNGNRETGDGQGDQADQA